MSTPTETEVKIRLTEKAAILERIEHAGLTLSVARQFEANTLYDTPDQSLRGREMLLRLRQIGDKAVVTWKGPGHPGPYKSRPELETSVGSIEILGEILMQVGYQPFFRYEKYRTEFVRQNRLGVVTVDETPIGDFLELEGPGDWIDEMAAQLGFSRQRLHAGELWQTLFSRLRAPGSGTVPYGLHVPLLVLP